MAKQQRQVVIHVSARKSNICAKKEVCDDVIKNMEEDVDTATLEQMAEDSNVSATRPSEE